MCSVQDLATQAKLDLSWLAALHYALKEGQGCISNKAERVLLAPEPQPFGSSAPEVTQEDMRNLNDAFAVFCEAAKAAPQHPADDGGHYLNKSAIVYAAAVVESFVKQAFDETFGERNSDGTLKPGPLEGFASLSSYISVITGQKAKGKHKCSIGTILAKACRVITGQETKGNEDKRKIYIKDFADGSEGVSFQAGLRNNIVHAHGVMNQGELNRITPLLKSVEGKGFPIGFENQFLDECRKSGRVCLHVVKVVVPCLRSAVDFISGAEAKFLAAAGTEVPGNPAP